jgi:hypothetical protein
METEIIATAIWHLGVASTGCQRFLLTGIMIAKKNQA